MCADFPASSRLQVVDDILDVVHDMLDDLLNVLLQAPFDKECTWRDPATRSTFTFKKLKKGYVDPYSVELHDMVFDMPFSETYYTITETLDSHPAHSTDLTAFLGYTLDNEAEVVNFMSNHLPLCLNRVAWEDQMSSRCLMPVMMGLHPRLGQDSSLAVFGQNTDVLRDIMWKYVVDTTPVSNVLGLHL